MEDLSLHILDIAENSIAAGARNIGINVCEDRENDLLTIEITDDGKGMSPEVAAKAADPFYTTRTTRNVGLGLALFQEAAAAANGTFEIHSAPNSGTTVLATFQLSHVDRKPLGDMVETIAALLVSSAELNLHYMHEREEKRLVFDTREIRNELGNTSISSAKAINVIRGYLNQEEETLAL